MLGFIGGLALGVILGFLLSALLCANRENK